jgi:uncharacterized protein DUF4062/CHAT domain-containing protein/AAA domain-containing protein
MELGRVFISSVFRGMLDLRKLAADAARLVGLEPVNTEDHTAQTGTVQEALTREIERCDTYVGIFDKDWGTVPASGTDNRSITAEEFHIACEKKLRKLVFVSKKESRSSELKVFLDTQVSEFSTGVWARPYKDRASLAREITASLSVLRPRVVLMLSKIGTSLEARLHLEGVKPAWTGDVLLGPIPVDLRLDRDLEDVLRAFFSNSQCRNQIPQESLRAAGAELAKRAFPCTFEKALEDVLDKAAYAGRLVILEVRTEDQGALTRPWELLSFPRHPLPVRQGLLEIVRRIPSPGENPSPSKDPALEVPAQHLTVLGFTASPLEDEVEVAQVEPDGINYSDLFWEFEQDRLLMALDGLVRQGRGRLILSDTGDQEELQSQLAKDNRSQVVHLYCHGGAENKEPIIFLEDSKGHRSLVGAEELLAWLRATPKARPIDLLVLFACDSSGTIKLAETLVRGGVRRVLVFQSSILEFGSFTEAFYSSISQGTDLQAALRLGRTKLLAKYTHDWAVPTLIVSRYTGPLVGPSQEIESGYMEIDPVRQDFSNKGVSYLETGYVGRREVERRLRHAFDSGKKIFAIHGLGGIGKSTIVSRFLKRRSEEGARLIILQSGRKWSSASLLEEIAKTVGVTKQISGITGKFEERVRLRLQRELRKISPTILLIDNFEDNQTSTGDLLDSTLREALAEIVEIGGYSVRLFFTSRLPVELPDFDAWNCDLGELSPSGCRKLRLLDPGGLGSLNPGSWRQVLFHFGGHPKALKIFGSYLKSRPDIIRTLDDNFSEALARVRQRLASKYQEPGGGRRLSLDDILASIPEKYLAVFHRLCLLEEALPTGELKALLYADKDSLPVAAALSWLRTQGLLASKVAPSALSEGEMVHRILASQCENALSEREGEEIVRAWRLRADEHIFQSRGRIRKLLELPPGVTK